MIHTNSHGAKTELFPNDTGTYSCKILLDTHNDIIAPQNLHLLHMLGA